MVHHLASAAARGRQLPKVEGEGLSLAIDEHLGDVDLRAHFGQSEAIVLERADGLTEGLALLGVGEPEFESGFGLRHGGHRDGQAFCGAACGLRCEAANPHRERRAGWRPGRARR